MIIQSAWKRVTVWSGSLVVAAVLLALLAAGMPPQRAAAESLPSKSTAQAHNGQPVFISTWGSGEISQTSPYRNATEILTYTGSDILRFTYVYDSGKQVPLNGYWTKWFDGAAAGLKPYRQWKHNLNAIWLFDYGNQPAGTNSGAFVASFTQNQQKDIPGIDGWVDGYDLVYWNGFSFSLWFDGEDVGLNNKTQEKIDALHVITPSADIHLPPTAPPTPPERGREDCLAYFLISTQGRGRVHVAGPGTPVLKFDGNDILGFCATSLGRDTSGIWSLVMDGSTMDPPLRRRDVDSLGMSFIPTMLYGLANRARPYHSQLFLYDLTAASVTGPLLDFADLGIHSPVDALHTGR